MVSTYNLFMVFVTMVMVMVMVTWSGSPWSDDNFVVDDVVVVTLLI